MIINCPVEVCRWWWYLMRGAPLFLFHGGWKKWSSTMNFDESKLRLRRSTGFLIVAAINSCDEISQVLGFVILITFEITNPREILQRITWPNGYRRERMCDVREQGIFESWKHYNDYLPIGTFSSLVPISMTVSNIGSGFLSFQPFDNGISRFRFRLGSVRRRMNIQLLDLLGSWRVLRIRWTDSHLPSSEDLVDSSQHSESLIWRDWHVWKPRNSSG